MYTWKPKYGDYFNRTFEIDQTHLQKEILRNYCASEKLQSRSLFILKAAVSSRRSRK